MSNLRKRYKTNTCLEDIYIFSISICENQIHRDIEKALIASKGSPTQPSLSALDKSLVTSIKQILEVSKSIQKENKEMKDELRNLKEKINLQNDFIIELKKTNEHILANQNALSLHNNENYAHDKNVSKTLNSTEVINEKSQYDSCGKVTESNQIPSSKVASAPTKSFANVAAAAHNKPFPRDITDSVDLRNNQSSEFILVGKNNKPALQKQNYKPRPVFGTKAPNRNSIAGERIVREFDIFVGGVNNDIQEDGMKNYIKDEVNVQAINVVLNKENKFNRSFKVTIKKSDKEKVFNPEVWDNNIIIKPFRQKRLYSSQSEYQNLYNQNRFFNPNSNDNNQYKNRVFQSRWDE